MEKQLNKEISNPFIQMAKEVFFFLESEYGYKFISERESNIGQYIEYCKDNIYVSIAYEWREQSFGVSIYDLVNLEKKNLISLYQLINNTDPKFDYTTIEPLDGHFDDQYAKLYEPLKRCAEVFREVGKNRLIKLG